MHSGAYFKVFSSSFCWWFSTQQQPISKSVFLLLSLSTIFASRLVALTSVWSHILEHPKKMSCDCFHISVWTVLYYHYYYYYYSLPLLLLLLLNSWFCGFSQVQSPVKAFPTSAKITGFDATPKDPYPVMFHFFKARWVTKTQKDHLHEIS